MNTDFFLFSLALLHPLAELLNATQSLELHSKAGCLLHHSLICQSLQHLQVHQTCSLLFLKTNVTVHSTSLTGLLASSFVAAANGFSSSVFLDGGLQDWSLCSRVLVAAAEQILCLLNHHHLLQHPFHHEHQ